MNLGTAYGRNKEGMHGQALELHVCLLWTSIPRLCNATRKYNNWYT
jgi:hypothetical protein